MWCICVASHFTEGLLTCADVDVDDVKGEDVRTGVLCEDGGDAEDANANVAKGGGGVVGEG